MNDISRIFMEISSENGNKYADIVIKGNRIEQIKLFLDKYIEFVSVNLQAELNRISCSTLGQLKTRDIGNKIKGIIEEHISRVIFMIEREKESVTFVKDYFTANLNQLYSKINEDYKAGKALQGVMEMNLLNDFDQIVVRLCDFEVNIIDRVLKYLTLINIQRRINRRGLIYI